MLEQVARILLGCAAVLVSCQCQVNETQNLNLAVFVSGLNTTVEGGDGRPFLSAYDMAIELINANEDILPGYNISYSTIDSQCQAGPSVRGFIEQIFMEPTKIMIIGADCSVSSSPIAELAPFYNLAQISPVSTSPALSDNSTFETFYRVVSSDAAVVEGIVNLALQFNWSRIAVISQQENIFTSTLSGLERELPAANLTAPREFSFNTGDNPQDSVLRLQNSPTRIIFVNTYQTYALEILCQAQGLGLTHGNGYVWLLYGWYAEEWWTAPPDDRSYTPFQCDLGIIEDMLEFAILVDHFPAAPDRDEVTDVDGLTRAEWEELLRERVEEDFPGADLSYLDQAPFFFDAMWAAALALNATQAKFDLGLFEYDPASETAMNISKDIQQNILQQNFRGISGNISFDEVGDRTPEIRYLQYQRSGTSGPLEVVQIGTEESGFVDTSMIFPSGVPADERLVFISLPLLSVYTVLSCIGIIFALVCLVFNLLFKDRAVVKYSSPYLNLLIIVGVILLYLDVILFGLDEETVSRSTVNGLCMTRVWIAAIAFSLVFGTIFAKTWRVYYIFFTTSRHKKTVKLVIRDYFLLGMVGVLLLVDLTILIPVTIVPASRLQLASTEVPSNSQALPQIISVCQADDRDIWLGVLLAYKALLLVISLFFAFETRQAKIRHINDTRVIGMCVLGIVILSVVLAAIGVLLEDFVIAVYAVMGILMLFGCTGVLCLLFVPKFYGLWKDPEGMKEKEMEMEAKATSREEVQGVIGKLSQEVERLKKELREVSGQQPELPRKAVLTEDSGGGGGKDSRRLDLGDDKELSVVSVTVHVPNDLHRSAQL